jgi:hypothetical protein
MKPEEELYKNLFPKQQVPSDIFMAGIENSKNALNKTYWLRLITAVVVRLSLIASVWVFIFNHTLWYGMILFGLLTIMMGGIQDINLPRKETK